MATFRDEMRALRSFLKRNSGTGSTTRLRDACKPEDYVLIGPDINGRSLFPDGCLRTIGYIHPSEPGRNPVLIDTSALYYICSRAEDALATKEKIIKDLREQLACTKSGGQKASLVYRE